MNLTRASSSAWRLLWSQGAIAVFDRARRHFRRRAEYAQWIARRGTLSEPRIAEMRAEIASFGCRPLLSVLMPVYQTDERWLRRAIESVLAQVYDHWELCVADDASRRPHVRRVLAEYATRDPRIKVVYRAHNGHISEASNSALALAAGEYVALLDHDDELARDALYHVAGQLARDPEVDVLYSDEDKLDPRGRRVGPYLKPDWSPDLFLSQNLVSHLGVYRTAMVRELGGFRKGYEGSQDYDLALRVIDTVGPARVRHIPHVLYHWRIVPGSAARGGDEKAYAAGAAIRALQSHLDRRAPGAVAGPGYAPFYRVRYPLPAPPPRVTVVVAGDVPQKRRADLMRSVRYPAVEWVWIDGAAAGVSPVARLNRAATRAGGEVLVFLDAALRPADDTWLEELVAHALRPDVGVSGGRVWDRAGRILHAGYLLAFDRPHPVLAAHAGLHKDDPGQMGRNQVVQNFLAVSGECLAVRRSLFEAVGGFAADEFPRALHDIDLCLRLRERGHRTVWTPHAGFMLVGRDIQAADAEAVCELRRRWKNQVSRDPYRHPALDPDGSDFRLPT